MKALFLDFDGVVIDSIEECFVLSNELFYGLNGVKKHFDEIRDLFYKYRGIVRPAYQYLALMKSIDKKIYNPGTDIVQSFESYDAELDKSEKYRFEHLFFSLRGYYQKDKNKWIENNPLTRYGKTLVNEKLASTYIITTKNLESVNLILEKYNIEVAGIYDKESYNQSGNKGTIIKSFLNNNNTYSSAVFVDDAVEHLDTAKDSRIDSRFADWGYGINTDYAIFTEDMWFLGR